MLLDLRACESTYETQAQVCIVGAGAAGITLARRLGEAGIDTILLETGGADHEDAVQSLARGKNLGHDYWELEESRLRFFGGTTAIWGGRCAEFDPIDFDRKDWVAHSGWPISYDDLAPYYADARRRLGLPAKQEASEIWQSLGEVAPAFARGNLTTDFWQFTPETEQFTLRKCDDLVASPHVRILLHATLTGLKTDDARETVRTVEASDISGRRARIAARHVVLAAGGIENARLLLACNLGNRHDQVGRYFMEHPHARGGEIVKGELWQLLRQFGRHVRDPQGNKHAALIKPSAEMQQREGILGSAFNLGAVQKEQSRQIATMRAYNALRHDLSPSARNRAFWLKAKKTVLRLHEWVDPARSRMLVAGGWSAAAVIRAEQAPNPDSRVMLGQSIDALGMREAALDWRFSEIDKHTIAVMMKAFAGELQRLGLGRFDPAPWIDEAETLWHTDPLICTHHKGGYHHMGTTRMSGSPREGVVDAECRVHGMNNLHVAGSSVFSTSGWANPTLGIAALGLRLADRLEKDLAGVADVETGLRRASGDY
ncbi:FAD-dependent oxidoreductase [Sphingomicrobium nitratireducens]|uniref:FAD-dependent oxidoreductase n=1 Tax=Sphingomicrobium nitratireducens TaxID=2964666 RepID=UPI00223ED177|nr:GMC family oxidoreductase [Sphingomicrobium nitratireducens]